MMITNPIAPVLKELQTTYPNLLWSEDVWLDFGLEVFYGLLSQIPELENYPRLLEVFCKLAMLSQLEKLQVIS